MEILALVTDAFGGNGGIALYTRNVVSALSAHPSCPRVTVLPRVIAEPPGPIPANVEFLAGASGGKLRYAWALSRTIARRPVDLVVCGHLHLLPYAWLARKGGRTPVVLFVYGIDAWSPTRHRVANRLLRKVDVIVSIRQLTLDRLASWADLAGSQHVLENAIALERYEPGPRDPALECRYGLTGKTVVMTVGRLAEQRKGFDEVLEVLPELMHEWPNLMYLVVGGGPDRQRLEMKATELGVEGCVVFTGQVDEGTKPDHYRLANAFVMAGSDVDFDRYPARFVFLEAMATGLPVVAATPEEPETPATAGLPRINVDPCDRASLVAGIRKALAQPTGVVPPGVQYYSMDSFTRRLHDILDSALHG